MPPSQERVACGLLCTSLGSGCVFQNQLVVAGQRACHIELDGAEGQVVEANVARFDGFQPAVLRPGRQFRGPLG